MSRPTWKALFTAGRVLLAAALLAWVLGRVHWRDYVMRGGESYAVLAPPGTGAPGQLLIDAGSVWSRTPEWRPAQQFEPVAPGRADVVRRGIASSAVGLDWAWMAGAILCTFAATLAASLRWRILLGVQGIEIPVKTVFQLNFLGEAFSTVMPGILGGDLVKAYYVARGRPGKARVLVSLFVDRLMGVCGFTAFAGVMLAVAWLAGLMDPASLRAPAVSVAAVVVGGTAALLLLSSPPLRRRLGLERLYRRLPFAAHLAAAGDAAARYRRGGGSLLRAAGVTVAAQALGIASIALAGLALGLPVAWYSYVLYVPLILILTAVPVTPGGVGVMEELYVVYLAGSAGPSMALALALLARLMMLLSAAPGLAIYALGPRLPEPEAVRAELDAQR